MDEPTIEARQWGRERAYWLKYCDYLNEKEGWDAAKRDAWLVAEFQTNAKLGAERGLTSVRLLELLRDAAPDVFTRIAASCPNDVMAMSTHSREAGPSTEQPAPGAATSDVPATDRTLVDVPSRTLLAEHRLGNLHATNLLAAANIRESVRLAVDSEAERSASDSRAKRVAAALAATQAIEDILQTRFVEALRAVPPVGLQSWRGRTLPSIKEVVLSLVSKDVPKAKQYGSDTLLKAATHGRAPSLAVVGGWFRGVWRIEPSALASALQLLLGIPVGLEEDTFEAGEVRNALAHRMNKERDPHESLGGALGHVIRVDCQGLTRLDVPDPQLAWLHWLAVSILKRKPQPRTTQDPSLVEEQIYALPGSD